MPEEPIIYPWTNISPIPLDPELDIFWWYKFSFSTVYPESGTRVQFGNNWIFSSKPNAPDQRIFKLTFGALKYIVFIDPETGAQSTDVVNELQYNLGALEYFYQQHRLWKSFSFWHPVHQWTLCRFNKPFEVPVGAPGGSGFVNNINVELIEQPV